jgi:hypothetical protein
MSDELTNENTEPTTVETPEVEPHGDAKEIDWKAQARKWESRAKEAQADKALADKWREYEHNQKSDHEKLADELARAQAEASQASAELLRLKVASEKGIPANALDLLPGSSREELESAADKLLSLIADQSKPKTPMPDENQGKPVPTSLGQLTEADLKNMSPVELNAARKAGRLNELLGIK